jgi:hypothetical protein
MKKIYGYIRDIPGGTPQVGATVTLRHDDSGVTVPTGGMWMLAGPNPVTTGADGSFAFTMELSPGPVRVEGVVGSETKVRSGQEIMQAGEDFISDLAGLASVLTNGVISGHNNEFAINAGGGTRQVVVAPGDLIIAGHLFGTETGRTLTHDAESVLTERWDTVVAEQHVGGSTPGRQNVAIVKGVTNQTDPALNTDPDIFQLPLARARIANGASTVQVDDRRTFASVYLGNGSVGANQLAAGAVTATAWNATDFNEAVQDQIGAHVKGGSNITATYDDATGDTTLAATGALGVVVQEGDVTKVAAADTFDFDASDFNVAESPTGEANISLAYGTSAGTPAEGSHTHSTFQNFEAHGARDVATSGSFGITSTVGQTVLADTLVLSSGVTYDIFVWGSAMLNAPTSNWIWAGIKITGGAASFDPVWIGDGTPGGERTVNPYGIARAIPGGVTVTVELQGKVGGGSGSIGSASFLAIAVARGSGGAV